MKGATFFLTFALALVLAGNAAADPVTIFTNTDLADSTYAAPTGTIWPTANASCAGGTCAGGGIFGAPISFTMPFAGQFTLTVTDCCDVGDVYQAFIDGVSVGDTSSVPLGGSTNSTGTFTKFLSAGAHTYDIDDLLLAYIGVADPYGGGTVPSYYSPAQLTDTGTVAPEPGTFSLLGMGLAGAAALMRRRKA